MFGSPASRLHKVVGGVSVILAPLLFAFVEITYPANGDGPVQSLASGATQPALWLTDIYLGIASSILFVVAYFALLNLLRTRGAVLGQIAFVFGLLGTCLSGLALAWAESRALGHGLPGRRQAVDGRVPHPRSRGLRYSSDHPRP